VEKFPVLPSVRKFCRKKYRAFVGLSKKGPVWRAMSWCGSVASRFGVRGVVAVAGESALDGKPTVPTSVKAHSVTSSSASVKWTVVKSSTYGKDTSVLSIRGGVLKEWETAFDGAESSFALKGLQPGTAYDCRVQATNSKGASEFATASFTTKLISGPDGWVQGPGYRWRQSQAEVEVVLDIPPGTGPRDLSFVLLKKSIAFALKGEGEGGGSPPALLSGDFFAPVDKEETFWELQKAPSGQQMEVLLTVSKEKPALWPCVVVGHPCVDIDYAKMKPKSE
jgi:hypothetical protein